VSGLRLHSLWGPHAGVRARIEGEDWVMDPDVTRTRVKEAKSHARQLMLVRRAACADRSWSGRSARRPLRANDRLN